MNLSYIPKGQELKMNRTVLFLVNLLFMVSFVIKNHALTAFVPLLVVSLFLYSKMSRKDSEDPAVVFLPLIIVADLVVYVGVHFQELGASFRPDGLAIFFSHFNATGFIMLVVALVLLVLDLSGKHPSFPLSGIGGTIAAAGLIVGRWSNGELSALDFAGYSRAMFLMAVFYGGAWFFLLYLISLTAPSHRKTAIGCGVIVLGFVLYLLAFATPYIDIMAPVWHSSLVNIRSTAFSWWFVIVLVVALLLFALYTILNHDSSLPHLPVDAYFAIILAEALLTIRLLLSNFFFLNWVLLPVLILVDLKCMQNDYSGKKTLGMNSSAALPVLFLMVLAALFLLKNRLFINLLLSALFGLLFVRTCTKKNSDEKQKQVDYHFVHCVLLILCVVSETLAWMWKFRSSPDSTLFLLLLGGLALATVRVLYTSSPYSNRKSQTKFSYCVCGLLIVLCLLSMNKLGTRMDMNIDNDPHAVTIQLEPRGKENKVMGGFYFWSDKFGRRVSDNIPLTSTVSDVPVANKLLTVVTVDSHGICTTAHYWYPHWVL